MPLATKNGSLIVKDGKLAENCGCCGGWYCCNFGNACAAADTVSVTIAMQCNGDMSGTERRFYSWGTSSILYGGATGPGYYAYRQAIVPSSAFAGTHQLSRETQDPLNAGLARFSKSATDAAGGVTAISVEIGVSSGGGGAVVFRLAYPVYYWSYNTISDSKDFKDLSQMVRDSPCLPEWEPTPLPPGRGDWECYSVGDYGTSAGWTFGCQLAPSQLSASRDITARSVGSFSWNCPFTSTITLSVQ
jgi:hypothetical protein